MFCLDRVFRQNWQFAVQLLRSHQSPRSISKKRSGRDRGKSVRENEKARTCYSSVGVQAWVNSMPKSCTEIRRGDLAGKSVGEPSLPIIKTIRSLRNYSKSIFCEKLHSLDWSLVYFAPNVDIALDNFNRLFLTVVDAVAPLRKIRLRRDTQPWMTAEILSNIRFETCCF